MRTSEVFAALDYLASIASRKAALIALRYGLGVEHPDQRVESVAVALKSIKGRRCDAKCKLAYYVRMMHGEYMKWLLLGLIFLCSIAMSFAQSITPDGMAEIMQAAQLETGDNYYHGNGVAQDYAIAAKWYRKAAEQGNADGQFAVGRMYFLGNGAAQDYVEAAKWYRKAAEQAHVRAQYMLGVMYARGNGVARDDVGAFKWYRKAAEQGNAYAQFAVGKMYFLGGGVAQDFVESAMWYRKAAEQGHGDAQYFLSLMYDGGMGVPQDYVLAYMWLNLASAQGNERYKKRRNDVVKRMTPEQVAEAQKLSREWIVKHTEK